MLMVPALGFLTPKRNYSKILNKQSWNVTLRLRHQLQNPPTMITWYRHFKGFRYNVSDHSDMLGKNKYVRLFLKRLIWINMYKNTDTGNELTFLQTFLRHRPTSAHTPSPQLPDSVESAWYKAGTQQIILSPSLFQLPIALEWMREFHLKSNPCRGQTCKSSTLSVYTAISKMY